MPKKIDPLLIVVRVIFAIIEIGLLTGFITTLLKCKMDYVIAMVLINIVWGTATYFMWTRDFTDDEI